MSDSKCWSSFEEDPEIEKRHRGGEERATRGHEKETFDFNELRNRLTFGTIVGFTTGSTFGLLEAFKLSAKKTTTEKMSALSRAAGASGGIFGCFFCAYQGIKFGLEYQRGADDLINVGVAGCLAAAPFLNSTIMRKNLPYGMMLVALDYFHEEISTHRK